MPGKKRASLFIAAEAVGRPRKIGSPEEMAALWDAYTEFCDNHTKLQTVVIDGGTIEHEIRAPLTYTIEGFCLFVPITQSAFNDTYRRDPDYKELIELIEEMTHIDARSKFEDGSLNPKLAALWMGRHKGYSTKAETEFKGGVPVVLSGEGDLKD